MKAVRRKPKRKREIRVYVYCLLGLHEYGSRHRDCPRCGGRCFRRVR